MQPWAFECAKRSTRCFLAIKVWIGVWQKMPRFRYCHEWGCTAWQVAADDLTVVTKGSHKLYPVWLISSFTSPALGGNLLSEKRCQSQRRYDEMEARRAGTCALCSAPIAKGALVLPVEVMDGTEGKMRTRWLHQHCVAEERKERGVSELAVCKHWQRTGACMFGACCAFAHPPHLAGSSADAAISSQRGQTADAEAGTRSWQFESDRGAPVRLHAARIPLGIPPEKVQAVFAQYGELVGGIQLRPMKSHGEAQLGWCIVKYADYAAASRAVKALNGGRLRFNAKTGEVLSSGTADGLDGAAGDRWESMTREERGLEWQKINRLAKAQEIDNVPSVKLWFAQLSRKKVRNQFRVTHFRNWLIDTFGFDLLRSGSGVLDVAGGKGELSFELLNLSEVPATVCDPRPLQFKMYVRRLRLGVYNRNRINARYTSASISASSPWVAPRHLRMMFETWPNPAYPHQEAADGGADDEEETGWKKPVSLEYPAALWTRENFESALRLSQALTWDRSGLHEDDEDGEADEDAVIVSSSSDRAPKQEGDNDKDTGPDGGGGKLEDQEEERMLAEEKAAVIECLEEARLCVKNASVVVGMHPDQASEAIVQYALANGKPLALVPCCVYSNAPQFRSRVAEDGSRIRTYDQFITYLTKKYGLEVQTLPFEGKNKVLFKR